MKHAFLIMAHNNFLVLKSFLRQLDSENNDIYLHIDKKVADFPKDDLCNCVNKSKLIFVERISIGYCDYTMVDGVCILFKEAMKRKYDYYHVASCADLLLHPISEFNKFFEKNQGKQFVGFSRDFVQERVFQKNFFIALCRHKSRIVSVGSIWLRKILINVQKKLSYNAVRNLNWEIKKGADWYSITHNAAEYLLEQETKFHKYFKRAFCPTEFFAQTILYNSHFRKDIYCLDDEVKGSCRFIDWNRGLPYVFKQEDFDLLISSEEMFGRKFMENIDLNIVNTLENYVLGEKYE